MTAALMPPPADLLPLTAASTRRRLPRNGRDQLVAPGTMVRWAKRGIRGRLLVTWRVGGRLYTSEAALAEFVGSPLDALPRQEHAAGETAPARSTRTASTPKHLARRLAEIQAAEAELRAEGVL